MSTLIDSSAEAALTTLAERFKHWRQSRTNARERIPEDLWDQAVALSTVLPNAEIAKRLRLSPTDLRKQRVAQQASSAIDGADDSASVLNSPGERRAVMSTIEPEMSTIEPEMSIMEPEMSTMEPEMSVQEMPTGEMEGQEIVETGRVAELHGDLLLEEMPTAEEMM